jgi:hypothetical protein|tara:strand:- start:4612 stop:4905 length:294 start_codon:yes stop_codon:yes gene_type:complete
MRYKDTPIKTNSTGDRVYGTTFYPKISIKDSDRFEYFPRGTRFDKIAYDSYGDATLWWIITLANGVTNADIQVDPTQEYRVPTEIESILSDFKKINE